MSQILTVPSSAGLRDTSGVRLLPSPRQRDLLPELWQRRLLLGFLLLGVAARCVRYFLRFPLWEDECFLCVNLGERGYLDLLKPLEYHQVAPVLFLWIQLTCVKILGFTELSLRLFPFLCSVAGLFLFRALAGRLLRGLPLLLAVATFAVAYPCIRYAAEAKQYASDQFVSLVLLTLVVEWWHRPGDRRLLIGLIGVVPVAVFLSYPAVFVAGGVSLVMAAVLWASGERCWRWWTAYNLALVGSFGLVFLIAAAAQSRAELGFMESYWRGAFPPLSTPAALPGWFLFTHTGDLLAYPVGGGNGASTLTFLTCLTGVIVMAMRRRWFFLLLVLTPFALNFMAAALHRYPYGGHFKFAQHLAPLICILNGLGAAAWAGRLSARPRWQRAFLTLSLLFPLLVGAGGVVRDLANPYKTLSDQRARSFAQWFWFCAEHEGEAVCLHTDLREDFDSKSFQELSWSAMYLCNQRIYSPRHAAGLPPRLDEITPDRPLRCLLYHDPNHPCNEEKLAAWLDDMQGRYQLSGREYFAFPRYDKRERTPITVDHVEIFRFAALPTAAQD
jgi:hypothetical protein